MRVCVDAGLIFRGQSGIGNYTYRILDNLYARSGVTLGIIVNDENRKAVQVRFPMAELIVIQGKCYSPLRLIKLALLFNTHYRTSFDILYFPHYGGLVFRGLFQGRVAVTVHDLAYRVDLFYFISRFKRIFGCLFFDFLIARVLKLSDVVCSVSETTSSDIKRIFDYNDLLVVKNVVDQLGSGSYIRPADVFIYIGNARPHKQLGAVLNAFVALPEYKLLLVGSCCESDIVGSFKHVSNIKCLGFVEEKDKLLLLESVSGLILCSSYEGCGVPVLEMLASGGRCIISDGGALKEFQGVNFSKCRGKAEDIEKAVRSFGALGFDQNEAVQYLDNYGIKSFDDAISSLLVLCNGPTVK